MNLIQLFQGNIPKWPTAPALLEPHGRGMRTTTFAELERRSAQASALLLSAGLRAGDTVLVLQPMGVELYAALLGVLRLGMIVMAVDPSAGLAHLARCCSLQPPRGLIANWKVHLLRLISPALRRIPIQLAIDCPIPGATRWYRLERMNPCRDIAPAGADTPALLTFTSGSTGQPKGAVRTHGLLRAQHDALSNSLTLTPGEVDLATMPIVLLANLASGVTSVIPRADLRRPGFIQPGPVVEQIRHCAVTRCVASPAFFACLARHCEENKITLPSLRKLFAGGAPVFPRLMDQLQAMAPNADVVALYGSTEAEPIAHVSLRQITPADRQATLSGQGLLAGKPVPEISLRIVPDQWGSAIGSLRPDEFDALCCRPHQPGEIVVTGEHVLKGYLGARGDEETKFRVGDTVWHRTGDAGTLDHAGRLWLLGRCTGRIDDDRGRLYPFAAEAAAHHDSHVQRAAAVACRGQRTLLLEWCDETRPGDVEAIQDLLRWAPIDQVRVWKRLPVDTRHNAKIDYPALFRQLQAEDRAG